MDVGWIQCRPRIQVLRKDNRIIDRQGFESLAGSCGRKPYFIQSEFLVMK